MIYVFFIAGYIYIILFVLINNCFEINNLNKIIVNIIYFIFFPVILMGVILEKIFRFIEIFELYITKHKFSVIPPLIRGFIFNNIIKSYKEFKNIKALDKVLKKYNVNIDLMNNKNRIIIYKEIIRKYN